MPCQITCRHRNTLCYDVRYSAMPYHTGIPSSNDVRSIPMSTHLSTAKAMLSNTVTRSGQASVRSGLRCATPLGSSGAGSAGGGGSRGWRPAPPGARSPGRGRQVGVGTTGPGGSRERPGSCVCSSREGFCRILACLEIQGQNVWVVFWCH